jgi:hypothetical protein
MFLLYMYLHACLSNYSIFFGFGGPQGHPPGRSWRTTTADYDIVLWPRWPDLRPTRLNKMHKLFYCRLMRRKSSLQ